MTFSKKQKNGILILFFFIIVLQGVFFLKNEIFIKKTNSIYIEEIPSIYKKNNSKDNSNIKIKNTFIRKSPSPTLITEKINIDINNCKGEDLVKIKGIGKILSKRIIKFRNALGGFVDKNQFNEVYGINDFSIKNLKKSTFIDKKNVKIINLKRDSFKVFLKHPYLDYNNVKIIFKFRDNNNLNNLEEVISKLEGIDKNKKEYLKSYLEI